MKQKKKFMKQKRNILEGKITLRNQYMSSFDCGYIFFALFSIQKILRVL